ncbi:hypothetical protein, partial [Streptococcus danieliae]|uniref:hypothetical protein n=1 Tax=Streptococcus danieliae TaxID=747656 RepID=UPI001C54F387
RLIYHGQNKYKSIVVKETSKIQSKLLTISEVFQYTLLLGAYILFENNVRILTPHHQFHKNNIFT